MMNAFIVFFLFLASSPARANSLDDDMDLLDIPYGSRVILKDDLSFEESSSRSHRAVTFQNGVLLKKNQKPSKQSPKCIVAARVPGTTVVRKSENLVLCSSEFLKSGNGKIYLEYQNRPDCNKAPGIAIICEPEDPNRDLLVRDMRETLGPQFEFTLD
jgi:hypothetical protein